MPSSDFSSKQIVWLIQAATAVPYILVIRSNHGMWLPKEQKVRTNHWRKFERTFSNGDTEIRYVREIIYGHRRAVRYWQLTTNPQTLPDNSTWLL